MTRFAHIAIPHGDILAERFTMDTYAARLWNVFQRQGPIEYHDAALFFEKTYLTEGLKTVLSSTEQRLSGAGGDAIIQLQTPFGGGKTHTLIALFHKANEWNAKPVVIVGSEMDAEQTLWGEIERQLRGGVQQFHDHAAPGSDSLSRLLNKSAQPVLILMDEVLQYLIRASAIRYEGGTLTEQTLAFVQSLTEAVASSENAVLITTLQSGALERYGENAVPLSERLEHLLGRMKKTMIPVADEEIARVIRRRLFAKVDVDAAERVVREFTDYADAESMLPTGTQKSEYHARFVESYPFQPDVIDVLYHKWGSFPKFQRTRALLRILALVVADAYRKNLPYISLADFDLSSGEIQGEFLAHAGQEYSSIIANDITAPDARAKAVDTELAAAAQNVEMGTRAATAIFLHSFTGGTEIGRGATLAEIKRSVANPDIPAVTIETAIRKLREHLFYLNTKGGRAYFDNEPNLTQLLQTRMENVKLEAVESRVDELLKVNFVREVNTLETCLAPANSKAVPDAPVLQLVVLPQRDDEFVKEILETCGDTPRVYRNALFFLTPALNGANRLQTAIRRHLACHQIQSDTTLSLTGEQRAEVAEKLKEAEAAVSDALRRYYATVLMPARTGVSEDTLTAVGTPLNEAVYERLVSRGAIIQTIHQRIILTHYLKDNDTVETADLLNDCLRTPGEQRVLRDAWVSGIRKGVAEGLFGLGLREGDKLTCLYFKQDPPATAVTLANDEVLIRSKLCVPPRVPTADEVRQLILTNLEGHSAVSTAEMFNTNRILDINAHQHRDAWITGIRDGVKEGVFGLGREKEGKLSLGFYGQAPPVNEISLAGDEVLIRGDVCQKLCGHCPRQIETVQLRFRIPRGKVSDVAKIMGVLQLNFHHIEVELKATEGEMSQNDYENRVSEAFSQLGIEVK